MTRLNIKPMPRYPAANQAQKARACNSCRSSLPKHAFDWVSVLLLFTLLIAPLSIMAALPTPPLTTEPPLKNRALAVVYQWYSQATAKKHENIESHYLSQAVNNQLSRWDKALRAQLPGAPELASYVINRIDYRRDGNDQASLWLEIWLIGGSDGTGYPALSFTQEFQISRRNHSQPFFTSVTSGPAEPIRLAEKQLPHPQHNALSALAYRWFALLDEQSNNPTLFRPLLSNGPLALSLSQAEISTYQQFQAWLSQRQQLIRYSHHDLGQIRIEALPGTSYQLTFELVRRRQGNDNSERLARIRHTWTMVEGTNSPPQIQRIQQRYLLPLPDMGMRVQC